MAQIQLYDLGRLSLGVAPLQLDSVKLHPLLQFEQIYDVAQKLFPILLGRPDLQ